MSTMHAGSLAQLIERLTGKPINIPITFIDNLNVVVLQGCVYIKGNLERRVLTIYEIERYVPEIGKIAAREVFVWNRIKDKHEFRGKYNSYILEKKVAQIMKLKDPKKIYEILELRARILQRMVEEGIFDFYEVWDVIRRYYEYGLAGLPFTI
jgi:flagellar protein FlaI